MLSDIKTKEILITDMTAINGAKAMQCVIEFYCFGLAADGLGVNVCPCLVEDYIHNLLLL